MTYGELDLKRLCKESGIDFAHYTYLEDQLSFLATPLDFPDEYWPDGVKPENKAPSDLSYIIFLNSYDYDGSVVGTDKISDEQFIEWQLPIEKLYKVCQCLQNQLGKDYIVFVPPDTKHRICACKPSKYYTVFDMEAHNFVGLKPMEG